MSAKGHRSRAWDDRFFPPWAWPLKFTLRAFSSITLAVILLLLAMVYCVLASVPIGLLALIPTWLVVSATVAAALAVFVGPPLFLVRRGLKKAPAATRFAATFVTALALGALAVVAWHYAVWPHLRYVPSTGEGLRFFADFVEAHKATTLRRLPAFEMTEGEFYAWWPLRVVLLLFVANMVIATVRRIEFRFENLGVLTVHSGIVVLTLGSVYYQSLKQEGDVLLLAGPAPGTPGPVVTNFMDRSRPALWASMDNTGWSAVPIENLPRYNDYGQGLSDRNLRIALPSIGSIRGGAPIHMSVVGFGGYVDLAEGWTPVDEAREGDAPLLDVEILSSLMSSDEAPESRPVAQLRLPAGGAGARVANVGGALFIEHVPPGDERWSWLGAKVEGDGAFALVVAGDDGSSRAIAINPGDVIEAAGATVHVQSVHSNPPFPIITPGYQDAQSAVAIVDVTTPNGRHFERWVFHRFPELNQDIHGQLDDGRPDRRPADPSIRIGLLDLTALQVYVRGDEAIVRLPGGVARATSGVSPRDEIELAPRIALRLAARWPAARKQELPVPVPPADRRSDFVGTHDRAAIAVELETGDWRQIVWLPFARFMNVAMGSDRVVELPDGRSLRLAFSRAPLPLPGITLQLNDFEMIPYAHSDIPRDYLSQVIVRDGARQETYTNTTRLNRPLIHRAPFQWSDQRSFVANALGAVVSVVAPNRFKFSQAGWDAEGWRETQAQVEAGRLDRPRAAFTILGVGNNPGIHIIALGGVMVCVGTPWAFYVKPWLLRRRSERLRAQHADRSKREQAPRAASEEEAVAMSGATS